MAEAMAVASLALGALGAVGQFASASDAEKAARRDAKNAAMENEEALRQERKANLAEESTARSRAAATGMLISGSLGEYLDEQASENRGYEAFMKRAGKSRVSTIKKAGKDAKTAGRWAALGSLGSTLGSGAQWYGK